MRRACPRTPKRQLPPGVTDRRQRSFKWFVTEQGLEYLTPNPPPVITPLDEPPNTRRVLALLAEAGSAGMRGSDIARHFTIPDPHMPSMGKLGNRSQSIQRRLAWTNQILERFELHDHARRGGKEPSPYYHNVPVYRWFITPGGVQFLGDGLAEGRRKMRRDREEAERVRLEAFHKQLADLLTQAYAENDPVTTPQCEREQVMRKLRDAGCTLQDIGDVFGVTRERVRQIIHGLNVNPCQCPDCTDKRWFEVGDGESGV